MDRVVFHAGLGCGHPRREYHFCLDGVAAAIIGEDAAHWHLPRPSDRRHEHGIFGYAILLRYVSRRLFHSTDFFSLSSGFCPDDALDPSANELSVSS